MKKIVIAVVMAIFAISCCNSNESVELQITYKDGTAVTEVRPLKVKGCLRGEKYLHFEMSQQELSKIADLKVLPSFARAKVGEEGYFLTTEGMLVTFKPLSAEAKRKCKIPFNLLALSGFKVRGTCYASVMKGLEFENYHFVEVVDDKEYQYVYHYNTLKDIEPYEPLSIDFYPLKGEEANYAGMARLYRQYLIETDQMPKAVRERVGKNEHLAYAAKAPEIRIRLAWKPVPTPEEHQTLENEPKMTVAVTFDQVKDIADELKRQGVENAELCLVGWNVKGHDGRFPDHFPVEEALGGEAKLRECIAYVQSLGYKIVAHTCRTDIYEISKDWNNGYDAARKADGSLVERCPIGGGMMYDICYKQSYEKYYKEQEPKVAELGFRGLEYIDVLSVIYPHECHNPEHPVNRKEAAEYANKMLAELRPMFGGSQSEGGVYYVAKSLDYALYASMNMNRTQRYEMLDDYVPVWHIVFNGYILNNAGAQTVNYTIKEPCWSLKSIEYASRPIFYFYSAYRGKGSNWMGETDLTMRDKADLERSVAAIKRGYDEFQALQYLQYEHLDNHFEVADGVKCSVYSDGTRIVVNYNKEPYLFEGKEVAAESYLIVK